jgi:hypothetical protein
MPHLSSFAKATDRPLRLYFSMHRFEWPDDEPVGSHLGHGDIIQLLRGCGPEVLDPLELRPAPPDGATSQKLGPRLGDSRRSP